MSWDRFATYTKSLYHWLDPDNIGTPRRDHIIIANSKFVGNTWDDSTSDLGSGFFRFNGSVLVGNDEIESGGGKLHLESTNFIRISPSSGGPFHAKSGSHFRARIFSPGDGGMAKRSAKDRLIEQRKLIEDNSSNKIILKQNHPNPFSKSTSIHYFLPEIDLKSKPNITISIYNVGGELIKKYENLPNNNGEHYIIWNGTDYSGKSVLNGIYFYRLQVGNIFVKTKIMNLLRK
jgi:hypothetical protein